jgi:nuclear pore complex protein Nup54
MKSVIDKWDPASPHCVFRYYFYNKVDERWAPYYSPAPYEDPKAWEEALAKKPGPGYIPVLCTGFQQMGERIKIQQQNLAFFNKKLHEINDSLDAMLNKHDLVLTVRALDARRRHTALKQRCLALATKAQVLRNRGYAMSASEEVLRDKLSQLEKDVCDPRVSARGEEIWARLVSVRERGKLLRDEVERRASSNGPVLDEEALRRAEKVSLFDDVLSIVFDICVYIGIGDLRAAITTSKERAEPNTGRVQRVAERTPGTIKSSMTIEGGLYYFQEFV